MQDAYLPFLRSFFSNRLRRNSRNESMPSNFSRFNDFFNRKAYAFSPFNMSLMFAVKVKSK